MIDDVIRDDVVWKFKKKSEKKRKKEKRRGGAGEVEHRRGRSEGKHRKETTMAEKLAMHSTRCRLIEESNVKEIMDSVDTILCDCDGNS